MADFETAIQAAIDAEEIPGCVLFASNRNGSFRYTKSFGRSSMKPGVTKPLHSGTVMWVASCTKLMTSICALQLVEHGKLSLDDPVYDHIPELKEFKILKAFDHDGNPVEVDHNNPITLRKLLTHTSGLTYDSMHPKLLAWLAYHGRAPAVGGTVLQRFNAPLTFEPGESWMYGPGIDYAGLLIERISGMTLEEYMRQNLWGPLGIKDMTFKLKSRPDMQERMADMSTRDENTGKIRYTSARMSYQDADGEEVQDCMGGQGVFTTVEEYGKVLQAILNMEENKNLLNKDTAREFFTPQLEAAPSAAMNAILQDETVNNAMGGTQKESRKDWGLGGLLTTEDQPDGKAANTMVWGGLPNLIWWIDRETGICGLYAGQVVPTGDAKCAALDRSFEAAMYKQYKRADLRHYRL